MSQNYRQSSARPFRVQSHVVAECGLALHVEISLDVEKTSSRGQRLLLQNVYIYFSLHGAFTYLQVSHAITDPRLGTLGW